jgi:hypothetical protein
VSHPRQEGYAKVKVAPGQFRFVRIREETPTRIVGERVTAEGERWEQVSREMIRTEVIVFSPSEIVQRMALNLHYCELEPA